MPEPVGVAIIGVGHIVIHEHLKHLHAMPNARLVGYLRNKSGRAAQAAEQFGGRLYDDADAIFRDPAVQAVYISVPPFAHGDLELKALAAGKAIFIEKPIATTLETAVAIAEKARATRAVTAVGYHWRYQATTQQVMRELAGMPVLGGCGWWCGDRPGVWWWRDKKTSGGQPTEQTTHLFDLANYILNARPISVYATGRPLNIYPEKEHTIDDMSVAQVRYDNGAAVSIWSSDVMRGRSSKVGLELYAVDRRYDIEFGKMKRWDRDSMTEINDADTDNAYRAVNEAFIHAVQTGDRSRILADYETSLLTHRVTMAVERSIASGAVESI
ncbi:MAG: Gfo/Idh/MocA family protein [Tepidisphaeraceae bacterium]